ncbi:MAG: XRE family transcriptional regulator [Roseburia hominis]|jgi:repressor LexA|uniref:helix-turn-helix domain-containing protein n=1 Tax=Roseburia hominis TaxID=301301 RepID=UPI0029063223|nr:XRE family transcriptional regulator [Roseburia hominis]MDU6919684.1 XRE family transcriptional regulator [Roseburia hominis]
MTLGQIIRAYREENSMSMDNFAKASGLSKGYISQLENNVNPKTGEPPRPSVETIRKAAKGMFMTFDEVMTNLDDDIKIVDDKPEVKIVKKAIRVPVLGNVAAGIPIEAIENVIDYEEISEELAHTGDFFALKIKGDSMEPRICNGDVVIVRKQNYAESGDLVIVLVNGDSATCKKLAKYPSGIRLIPFNQAYEPLFYSNEEIENKPVRIIGRVVENRQKY